jgi:hypothetical protein
MVLLAAEVSIATQLRHSGWIRGFLGDAIAVVLVYCALRTVVRAAEGRRKVQLAAFALLIGYGLELVQYLARANGWMIRNRVLRIVVGSTPDWWDIVAYTAGFACIGIGEWYLHKRSSLRGARASSN